MEKRKSLMTLFIGNTLEQVAKSIVREKESKYTISEIVNRIQKIGYTQGLNNAFTTFLEMMAVGLAIDMDPTKKQERETRVEELEKGLSKEILQEYASLCALMYLVVKENLDSPIDILGTVYHELRLNNEWNGQFFTPDNICRMMALMAGPYDESIIQKKGYITINEPSCGSGTMVIAAAWAMQQRNMEYQKNALFIAQDIDIRCVWMAYIQFCLYRIPAVVIHGNTLTCEEWSRWYTSYFWKLIGGKKSESI